MARRQFQADFLAYCCRRIDKEQQKKTYGDELKISHVFGLPDAKILAANYTCSRPEKWMCLSTYAEYFKGHPNVRFRAYVIVSYKVNKYPH